MEVDSGAIPDLLIVWTKDGETVGSGRRLVMRSVGSKGVFTAVVKNEAGTAADSVDVRVAGQCSITASRCVCGFG